MLITRFTIHKRGHQSLLALSLFIVAFACEDEGTKSASCQYHSDCPLPERCLEGSCRLECRVSTDCESGARCYEGVCHMRPSVCASDEDCAPFQELCDPGYRACVAPGELSSSGGSGAGGELSGGERAGATWAPSAGAQAGTPSGGSLAGTSAGGGGPSAGGLPPSAGAAAPSGGEGGVVGLGTGRYGDPCVCPSDCESGYCVQNKMKRSRTCSAPCEEELDCPGIDTCLQAEVAPAGTSCPESTAELPPPGTVVGVCIPNETSYPCVNGSECTSGICLTPGQVVPWADPQAVCTMRCESDLKCPTGYRCAEAPGADGEVCIPVTEVSACPTGEPLTCGGVCPLDGSRAEEDLVICVGGYEQTAGYCSCSCRDAQDCPNGFACSRVTDTGDPTRPGLCVPFAGAVCPESTRGVEQCLSMTCLVDEESPAQSQCTSFCEGPQDCPRGYQCTALEGGSVCLPPMSR